MVEKSPWPGGHNRRLCDRGDRRASRWRMTGKTLRTCSGRRKAAGGGRWTQRPGEGEISSSERFLGRSGKTMRGLFLRSCAPSGYERGRLSSRTPSAFGATQAAAQGDLLESAPPSLPLRGGELREVRLDNVGDLLRRIADLFNLLSCHEVPWGRAERPRREACTLYSTHEQPRSNPAFTIPRGLWGRPFRLAPGHSRGKRRSQWKALASPRPPRIIFRL